MSSRYPETIPEEYTKSEYLISAYRRGWNHGHGVACHVVPELGAELFIESEGRVTVDEENIRYVHEALCRDYALRSRWNWMSDFDYLNFEATHDGGWFIMKRGDEPRGPFDTYEEAEATAEDEDDGDWYEIVNLPSEDDLLEAFERGEADSIAADLAEYTDEEYGIEDEDS